MPWAAIIPAVASVAAAGISAATSKKGATQTTTQATDKSPWTPQGNSVQNLYNKTDQTLNDQIGSGVYTGDFKAGTPQALKDAAGNYIANGNQTAGYVPGVLSAGASGLAGLPTATQTAGALASGNFDHGDPSTANAVAGNANNMLWAANKGVDGALSGVNENTMGHVVNQAGQYINNNVLQGQIDAASRDVTRNLYEDQLPTLNAQAIAGGNLNSSRAGAAEAIATRGAGDRLADIAGTMRGNAYQTGSQLAEGLNQANINGNLGAASAGNAGTGQALSGAGLADSIRTGNIGIMQNGASLSGNLATTGANILTAGNNLGASAAGQVAQGGTMQQAADQNTIDNGLAKWNMQDQYPWQKLQNASGILQAVNWGGQSSGTQQQTTPQSLVGNVVGGAALGANLGTTAAGVLSPYINSGKPAAIDANGGSYYSTGGDTKATYDPNAGWSSPAATSSWA
jgi:hypothetical protein